MSTSLESSSASQPWGQLPCKRTAEVASGAGPLLTLQTTNVWGHWRKQNPPSTPCCCTEWRLLTGSLQTQPAGLFRSEKYTYQEITKSHSLAAMERKPSSITPEPQCLLQCSTEEASIGNHQNVHWQMSGYGRRPTYMQWMMTQPETRRKSCQLFLIGSPSDDHTDSRKSDREGWTVYIRQRSGGIQKHHKWTSFPNRDRFPAGDIKLRLGKDVWMRGEVTEEVWLKHTKFEWHREMDLYAEKNGAGDVER